MRVLLTSPWVPAEWIRAHGLESRGIWFSDYSRRTTPSLSAGVCAFAENAIRFAKAQPEDAVIFTSACDQMRRGFDAAVQGGARQSFLFNLPATQTLTARQIYRTELERLGQFLEGLGGLHPAPERLRTEIQQTEENRRKLNQVASTTNARSFAMAVAQFQQNGSFSAPQPVASQDTVPLALVGGPLSVSDWNLFDFVEAAGARIALNATDAGERCLTPNFLDAGDPFEQLATGYFNNVADVFQRPNSRLYDWLKTRLFERQIKGILLWHFTGCDLWRAEAQSLREAFHLPVLLLEADEATGLSPRDVTRLQAFVEMLK